MPTVYHPESPIHSAYGALTSSEWDNVIRRANGQGLSHDGSVTGVECARCAYMDREARGIVAARGTSTRAR